MNTKDVFLLDANVFIEAARRYYAFDIVPSFLVELIRFAQEGSLLTIDHVKNEIEKGNDILAKWMINEFYYAANTNDIYIADTYSEIMQWVYGSDRKFNLSAQNEFASGADGWLIAYAFVKGCYLVTHEVYKPDIKRKVPIPNVCQEFDVPYLDTFSLMRKLPVVI